MRKFFSIGASEALARGLSWLSLASLPFFVSSAIYGEVSKIYSLLMMAFPLILIGQDRVVLASKNDVVSSEIYVSLVLTSLTALVMSFVVAFFYVLSQEMQVWYLALPLAAWALVANKILLCYYRVSGLFHVYSLNRVLYSALRLVCVIFSVVNLKSMMFYVSSEFASAILCSIRLVRFWELGSIRDKLYQRLREGSLLAVHGLSAVGLSLSDRFIIGLFYTSDVVGNYSFAYTIASALIFPFGVVALIFEPKIYSASSSLILSMVVKDCLKKMLALGVVGAVALSSIYYFSFSFIHGYDRQIGVFLILLISHLIMPFYLVASYILIGKKSAASLVKGTLISVVVNIILNLALLPTFGVMVAAVSTLVGNCLLVLLTVSSAKRVMRRDMDSVC